MNPSDQLISLFEVFLSPVQPAQEIVNEATNQLLKLYENPETLYLILDLFQTNQNLSVKLFCTTGIKNILSSKEKWNVYQQSGHSGKIKSIILNILHNEENQHIFSNFLSSIANIISCEYSDWPEYLAIIQEFASNESKLLCAVLMANAIAKESDDQFATLFWEFFCNLCVQGLSSNNESIILESSHLLTNMFHFPSEFEENLANIFTVLFQVFTQLMAKSSSICGNIIDDFDEIANIDDFNFPNTEEIVNQFLILAMNPNFDIDNRCFALSPAIQFLIHDPCADISSVLGTMIDVLFSISVNSFLDDLCTDNQDNMNIIQDYIDNLLSVSNPKELYYLIKQKGTGGNSQGEIVTFAFSLITIANSHPDLIVHDITSFLNIAFTCIETPHHCIQEAGFDIFESLFTRRNDAYYGIQKKFFQIAFQVFSSTHFQLILKALKSIYHYLDVVEIDQELIPNVFTALIQVIQQINLADIQSRAIDCLGSLIKSLAEDIIIYIQQIVPLIIQALMLTKPEEVMVRASAIECSGLLIRYCPDLGGICPVEHVLHIFGECIQSDDNVLISSVFWALRQLVIAKIPQVISFLPTAFQIAHNILRTEPTFYDDIDKNEQNDVILDLWSFSMNFIGEIAKRLPETLQGVINEFKADFFKLIDDDIRDDIQGNAVKAASSLIRLIPNDIPIFLTKIAEALVDTNSPSTASIYFETIGSFIDSQSAPLLQDIIACCCVNALQGMRRELPFQEEEKGSNDYDIDYGGHMYMFLKIIASVAPSLFPINEFWKAASLILRNGTEFEQAEIISVLSSLFYSYHANIPPLYKKKFVKTFVEKLEICDCYNPPDPILAVQIVVDTEVKQIERYVPQIMETVDSLLTIEYEDQLTYSMTMESLVSLLFSLFRCIFKENFDVQKYLPKMLFILPATNIDASAACNIYYSLCLICSDYPQVMSHFSPDIVRIFSQTLALKEKDWNQIGITDGISKAMSVLLTNLLNSMQQGNEILNNSLPDPASMKRFQNRFAMFST